MLNETSQTHKEKVCMTSLVWNLEKLNPQKQKKELWSQAGAEGQGNRQIFVKVYNIVVTQDE